MSHNLKHIAFIMDGNRRWAHSKNLDTMEGHKKGYEKMKKVVSWCIKREIKIITFWAFSTENWKRSEREVSYLMKLLKKALNEELEEFTKQNVVLKIIGRKKELSADLQTAISAAEEKTKNGKDGIVNIGINYGGRAEIIDAVLSIINKKVSSEKINEETFSDFLYTKNLSDPDLIIRSSGEQRLSGFLAWQSAYSELYFPQVHWPAFSETDLDKALNWYTCRKRRFGGN